MPGDMDESDGSGLDSDEADCYSSACEDVGDDSELSDVDERLQDPSEYSLDLGDGRNGIPRSGEEAGEDAVCSDGFEGFNNREMEIIQQKCQSFRRFRADVLERFPFKQEENCDVRGLEDRLEKPSSKKEFRDTKRSRPVRKAKLKAESFIQSHIKEVDRNGPRSRTAPMMLVTKTNSHPRNLLPFYFEGVKLEPCFVEMAAIPETTLQQHGLKQGSSPEQYIDLETLSKGLYPCDQCSFRTNFKRELAQHQWTHKKDEVCYKCSMCSEKFRIPTSLYAHVKRKHRKARKNMQEKAKKTLHQCSHCDYSCPVQSQLRIHTLQHTGEKPFACPHCPYRARQHPHLRQHLYFHLDLKPYACHLCDFKTRQKSHLTKHLLWVHTDKKPFKCSKCDYSAKSKKTLDTHFTSQHTDIRRWACKFCPYKTAHNNSYNAHMKAHKVNLDFSCPECSWSSNDHRFLGRHVLECHPNSELIINCDLCDYRTVGKNVLENHLKNKHRVAERIDPPIVKLPIKK